jgi:hypothetical protein
MSRSKLPESQSGFTALHILLVLIILGIVSFAGWKVFESNTQKSTPDTYKAKREATVPQVGTSDSDIPEGFAEYKNEELGFKFAYPKDWQVVPVSLEGKKSGLVLKLVSPAQKKAYEDFLKLGKATEGPYNFDLEFSHWDSINNEYAKAGSYLDEPGSYKNLEDYLANKNSMKHKVGDFNIGAQKVYEVRVAGFSQSYAIMFEKPNGNIYELGFINISGKSDADLTTKKIIDSIQIF